MQADDTSMVKISLVIPAWNEAALLPRLLDSVAVARQRWTDSGRSADEIEVIVADNGSTDATTQIASERGCRVVPVEKRVIAASRNGGATVARGEILGFIDADSIVHPDSFIAIAAAMNDMRAVGGATGVIMERWSAGIALVYAMMLPMVWLTGFDSGVVFCRRSDFLALGGYDENRLIAEDVDFLWRLRRLGRTRGQHLLRLPGVKAITSTRKFDQHGDWHWFTQFPAHIWRVLRNRDALKDFAHRYWYDGR